MRYWINWHIGWSLQCMAPACKLTHVLVDSDILNSIHMRSIHKRGCPCPPLAGSPLPTPSLQHTFPPGPLPDGSKDHHTNTAHTAGDAGRVLGMLFVALLAACRKAGPCACNSIAEAQRTDPKYTQLPKMRQIEFCMHPAQQVLAVAVPSLNM